MLGLDLSLSTVTSRGGKGPALALDFAAGRYQSGGVSKSLGDLSEVSFARAGAGLAFDAVGGLVSFAANVPRITDAGLLLETAATNLLTHSSPAAGSWFPAGPVRTAGEADPLGGASGCRLSFPASADAFCYAVVALAATAHVVSIFARTASGTKAFRLAYFDGTSAHFSGDVVATTTWTRFSFAFVGTGAGGESISIVNDGSGQAGDLWVAMAQVELGSGPSSPIETVGSPVTRAADVASVVIPAGVERYAAVYGEADTGVSGPVTPGAIFDLIGGRPWLKTGLKRLTIV